MQEKGREAGVGRCRRALAPLPPARDRAPPPIFPALLSALGEPGKGGGRRSPSTCPFSVVGAPRSC
jgi:hypothetical protein